MLYEAVVFRLDGELPSEAKLLMEDFRLAVNCAVRAGLQAKVTSRYALVKLLYKGFREEHPNMYAQHLVCSFEVAGSLLKNLRRRIHTEPALTVLKTICAGGRPEEGLRKAI